MTDRFGREITYLRLSVTELCNLRCRYCMPEAGICKKAHGDMLSEDEMVAAVEAAASLGIQKLRITGGEPLVKPNILSICRRCAQVDGINEVCLTTNGTLLPQLAKPLREAGVSRVNISLDTLNPEKYAEITRKGSLENAMKGLVAALEAGFKKVKINAVLIGGFNEDEIPGLCELTRKYPVDVRFIELMPMTDGFSPDAFIPCSRVLDVMKEAAPLPADGGVARLYRLPGAIGNIGLISPISSHFCGSCNRLRLTADGKIKACLHSSREISIKGLSREEMQKKFLQAIEEKPLCHGELSGNSPSKAGRSMNRIGG